MVKIKIHWVKLKVNFLSSIIQRELDGVDLNMQAWI